MIATVALFLAHSIASSPDLGKAAGQCRPGESGPAYLVSVVGLKDRKGRLKLELYPANDDDFLADDNVLLQAGKPFARVEIETPRTGDVEMCIRAPYAGTFALSLLHDRDSNRKFGLSVDGIGFSSNPRIGWAKPKAADASLAVGSGPTHIRIVMNYRHGLFSLRPLGE